MQESDLLLPVMPQQQDVKTLLVTDWSIVVALDSSQRSHVCISPGVMPHLSKLVLGLIALSPPRTYSRETGRGFCQPVPTTLISQLAHSSHKPMHLCLTCLPKCTNMHC